MYLLKYGIIIIIFLIQPSNLKSTTVQGDVSGIWKADNNPYFVVGDAQVPAGASLRIEPGVSVLFTGNYYLKVSKNGLLLAWGNEKDYIIFRGYDTETNWAGLRFYDADSSSILSYCIIEQGYASRGGEYSYGGAIYLSNSNIKIINCIIQGNRAYRDGGGISSKNSHSRIIKNIISNNISEMSSGGGIYSYYSNDDIRENIIMQNSSEFDGGGIACKRANPIIEKNYILGNYRTQHGGGISSGEYGDPIIKENVIAWNYADLGGGINTNCSNAEITDNIIISNTAQHSGGVCLGGKSNPIFAHNIVCKNIAVEEEGGIGILLALPVMYNNTICFNEAVWAGGVHLNLFYPDTLKIINSIIWGNKGGSIKHSGGYVTAYYCDIEGGWTGIGVIDQEPLFVNPESANYNLFWGSPCIDSGDPLTMKDPDSTVADIGAYFFKQEKTPSIELYSPVIPFIEPYSRVNYDLWMYNISNLSTKIDFWTYLISPGGKRLGPINLKKNIVIEPKGYCGKNDVLFNLPWKAPLGVYKFSGYIGKYPFPTDSSSVVIIKNDCMLTSGMELY